MFKKVAFAVPVLALLVVLAVASAAFAQGKTYLIQTGEQGYSEAVDQGSLDFAGEGWAAGSVSGEGVDFFVFKAAPGAPLAAHKSPDAWVSYVVKGFGELGLTDEAGNQKSVIRYRTGDILIFDADTMHSWKNGSVESILIFVKKQAE